VMHTQSLNLTPTNRGASGGGRNVPHRTLSHASSVSSTSTTFSMRFGKDSGTPRMDKRQLRVFKMREKEKMNSMGSMGGSIEEGAESNLDNGDGGVLGSIPLPPDINAKLQADKPPPPGVDPVTGWTYDHVFAWNGLLAKFDDVSKQAFL
jgi:hypothetical protein